MSSNSKWTADNIPDLSGKTIIVTGANSGTGFQATKVLSSKGADVIMACRNPDKAIAAFNAIKEEQPHASLEVMELDLASLSSIREFSETFHKKHNSLDILINNAGVMMTPKLTTEDGFELQMGTNHLGHYALTGLLFDLLKETDHSRIVNMSSGLHTSGDIDFDDLFLDENYNRTQAYANSKLANLYFTYELQRKLDSADLDIKSIAAHPGYTATNLQKSGLTMNRNWLLSGLIRVFTGIGNFLLAMKPEKGTLGILRAATDPELSGGEYIGPKRMKGYPEVIRSNSRSYDEEAAEKLWTASEELTGISFDFKKN